MPSPKDLCWSKYKQKEEFWVIHRMSAITTCPRWQREPGVLHHSQEMICGELSTSRHIYLYEPHRSFLVAMGPNGQKWTVSLTLPLQQQLTQISLSFQGWLRFKLRDLWGSFMLCRKESCRDFDGSETPSFPGQVLDAPCGNEDSHPAQAPRDHHFTFAMLYTS